MCQYQLAAFWLFIMTFVHKTDANPPMIHFSHNMRILKIPEDTPTGTIVYRIKATDADNDTISFGVLEDYGRQFLRFDKINDFEANVVLVSPLNTGNISEMNLTIYANDSNEATYIDSQLMPTLTTDQIRDISASGVITVSENPIFVPENATFNESIATISAYSRDDSKLPVMFELMQKNTPFRLENIFSPNSSSKARLFLVDKLDYEQQNLYIVTILAINARIDEVLDTRNVHCIELAIVLRDMPDTAPIFHNLPSTINIDAHDFLQNHSKFQNEQNYSKILPLFTVIAEDGDHTNKRNISFRIFEPNSENFEINAHGHIRAKKSYDQLATIYPRNTPIKLEIQADEVTTIYPRNEHDKRTSINELLILLTNKNRPPKFALNQIRSDSTSEIGNEILEGFINENSPKGTIVQWKNNIYARIFDYDDAENGTVTLSIYHPGTIEIFRIEPEIVYHNGSFLLLVNTEESLQMLDFETNKTLSLTIVARDSSREEPLETTIQALIHIYDVNDHWPQFSSLRYEMSVFENSPIGTVIGQVLATDLDSEHLGTIRYKIVYGNDNVFKIDFKSGTLTVASNDELDREKNTHFWIIIEASDQAERGNTNRTEVRINVTDLNDNAPVFLNSNYLALIHNNRKEFLFPIQVTAIDIDEINTTNSYVNYEILHGNYNEQFELQNESGELKILKNIMKNNPTILTVRAYDHGIPQQSSIARIHIYWPISSASENNMQTSSSCKTVETIFRTKHRLWPSLIARNDHQLEEYLGVLTGGNVTIHSLESPSSSDGISNTESQSSSLSMPDAQESVAHSLRRRQTTTGTDIRTVIKYSNRSIVNLDAIGEALSRLIYSEDWPKFSSLDNEKLNKSTYQSENNVRPSFFPSSVPSSFSSSSSSLSHSPNEKENKNKILSEQNRADHERIDSLIRGRHMTHLNDNHWTLQPFGTATLFNLTGMNIAIWILFTLAILFLLLLIYLLCLICCHKRQRKFMNKLGVSTPSTGSTIDDDRRHIKKRIKSESKSMFDEESETKVKSMNDAKSFHTKFLDTSLRRQKRRQKRSKVLKVMNKSMTGSGNQSVREKKCEEESIDNDGEDDRVEMKSERQYIAPSNGTSYYEFKHVRYPRDGTERTINILSLNDNSPSIGLKSLLQNDKQNNLNSADITQSKTDLFEKRHFQPDVSFTNDMEIKRNSNQSKNNQTNVLDNINRHYDQQDDDDSIVYANQQHKLNYKNDHNRKSIFTIAYDKIGQRNDISSGSENQNLSNH